MGNTAAAQLSGMLTVGGRPASDEEGQAHEEFACKCLADSCSQHAAETSHALCPGQILIHRNHELTGETWNLKY